MKKNRGYTLIELIAVIVILGMLLMIVIPATGRLIASNDKRTYEEYYKLVGEAARKYARGQSYDLGGVSHSGCIELNTIDTFISAGLIKPFAVNDDDIECYLPSELTQYNVLSISERDNLEDGKPASSFYDIRINNNKGKLNIQYSLVCIRKNRTVVYKNLIPKDGSECNKYVPAELNILYNHLIQNTSTFSGAVGDERFVNTTDNYVKYSGKLWRIVSANTATKTIKMISDEVVSFLNYDETAYTNYRDSNIETWIDYEFKPSLRNANLFLMDTSWNYSYMDNSTNPPANNANKEVQSTVGLLNYYEYDKVKDQIGTSNSNWFLLSPQDAEYKKIWNVKPDKSVSIESANTFSGIRPVVTLRPGVTFQSGGNGSSTSPYQIVGESTGLVGERLATRYVGEYVKFNGKKYRIMSITGNGIRMFSNDYTSNMVGIFDNSNIYTFGGNIAKISSNMNTYFYDTISAEDKDLMNEIEFCTTLVNGNTQYSYNCQNDNKRIDTFAIPKVGEMYIIPTTSSSYNFWTLSPSLTPYDSISGEIKDPEINVMTTNGLESKHIRQTANYNPVVLLKTSAKITGGDGSDSNPYTITNG